MSNIVYLTLEGRNALAEAIANPSTAAITVTAIDFYDQLQTPSLAGNIPSPAGQQVSSSGTINVAVSNNTIQFDTTITALGGTSYNAYSMCIFYNVSGNNHVFAYSNFSSLASLPEVSAFVAALNFENSNLTQAVFNNTPIFTVPIAGNAFIGGVAFSANLPSSDGILYDTDASDKPLVLRPSQVQTAINGNYWYGTITIHNNDIQSLAAISSKNITIDNDGTIHYATVAVGHNALLQGEYLSETAATTQKFATNLENSSAGTMSLPLATNGIYILLVKETLL